MMILSLTAGLAACGLAGEGSQAAAKDAGVQRYACLSAAQVLRTP